jgi:hypothetical protein
MDENRPNSLPPKASSRAPQSHSNAGNEREIAARISTLLSHYWTADDSPQVRALQLEDWLSDLAKFPPSLVALACQEYRREGKKRPTPADVRLIAIRLKRERDDRNRPRYSAIEDQRCDPPPDPNLVRENWRKVPFTALSAAERELFRASFGIKADEGIADAAKRLTS